MTGPERLERYRLAREQRNRRRLGREAERVAREEAAEQQQVMEDLERYVTNRFPKRLGEFRHWCKIVPPMVACLQTQYANDASICRTYFSEALSAGTIGKRQGRSRQQIAATARRFREDQRRGKLSPVEEFLATPEEFIWKTSPDSQGRLISL